MDTLDQHGAAIALFGVVLFGIYLSNTGALPIILSTIKSPATSNVAAKSAGSGGMGSGFPPGVVPSPPSAGSGISGAIPPVSFPGFPTGSDNSVGVYA